MTFALKGYGIGMIKTKHGILAAVGKWVLSGCFILSSSGNALASDSNCTWASYWAPIADMLISDNGIEVNQALTGAAGASFDEPKERSWILPTSDANYEAMAAMLTSAYFAGHSIAVCYDGNNTTTFTNTIAMAKVRAY